MEKFLKENIQPAVRLSSPALKTFTFKKIHFGHIVSSENEMKAAFLVSDGAKDGSFHPCFCSQPLKIKGMRVYTHEVDQREVVLDLDIRWEKTHFSLQSCFLCVTPVLS